MRSRLWNLSILSSSPVVAMVTARRSSPRLRRQPPDPLYMAKSLQSSQITTVPCPVTPSPKKKRKAPSPSVSPDINVLSSEAVAAIAPHQAFADLKVPPEELRPSTTLTTGQAFNWKKTHASSTTTKESAWGSHDATEWVGTLRVGGDSIVLVIRETPTTTLYRPLTIVPSNVNIHDVLFDYFQLQHSLKSLYRDWSNADQRLAAIAKCIVGVRVVNQDPWETLISFICSSNNNIPRITKMLASIRTHYGEPLVTIENETFYSFPSLERLLEKATDTDLRNICGLGYRSKYIMETMKILKERGGEDYLYQLREIEDATVVQEKLCGFCGVGRKVADCVALFSLKQDSAIPVDVHVWNIALRDYDSEGLLENAKSLTPIIYKSVGNMFRSRFLVKPGWAHSLLFVAELPSFRSILPHEMIAEMDTFRQEEQARKQEAKRKKKSQDD
jgi:N-glycosylase/DNA lyase